MNKNYTKKEDMINKLQSLKGEIKVKNNQNFSNFYDAMNSLGESGNFHFEDDPFSKFAWDIAMTMHEGMLLMKFLQTEP